MENIQFHASNIYNNVRARDGGDGIEKMAKKVTYGKSVGQTRTSVNDNFHFGSYQYNAIKVNQALEYYNAHPLDGQNWLYAGDMPIFIDTNVLIDLYSSSYIARDAFLNFMQRNSNRIVIPRHVLDEYMSKRMYVIEKIPQDVANKRERLENVAAKLEKPHAIFEDQINSELHERGFLHDAPNVKDILRQILDNLKNRLQVDEEYNKLIERLRESIRINNDDLRIVTHKADPILSAICKAVLFLIA